MSWEEDFEVTRVRKSSQVVWLILIFLVVFLVWAYVFEVEEVSNGTGKVVPTSREQTVQSLEGGILSELLVAEGDVVEKDQILAQLDATRGESSMGEVTAKYRAALASSTRLQAEVSGADKLVFPDELKDYPELRTAETELFNSRKKSLRESLAGLNDSLRLINRELEITRSLLSSGAASNVELLRLQRQQTEVSLKISEVRSEYMVRSQEELSRSNAELESLTSVVRGRSDSVTRLTHKSPVRGVVKDIEVTTIGGVVPPNGKLMVIVPLDDQLLIEARISPRDIAFIHPRQQAMVKITAYDYAIYGGLPGEVVTISPDTLRDEVKQDQFYYRVYIRTESDALKNKAGKNFPIVPGMMATVDIKTGSKTVFDYLIKPVNRAREALRER